VPIVSFDNNCLCCCTLLLLLEDEALVVDCFVSAEDELLLLEGAAVANAAATDGGLLEAVFFEKKEKRFFCLLLLSGAVLTMVWVMLRSIDTASADAGNRNDGCCVMTKRRSYRLLLRHFHQYDDDSGRSTRRPRLEDWQTARQRCMRVRP